MSSPRVSFAPKLATVVHEDDRSRANAVSNTSRRVVLVRILALALVVIGLASGLHFGTASHREELRKAQIEAAIATSGVESAASQGPESQGSANHE
jgi:hypothetical protein